MLITEGYRELNRELHAGNLAFGVYGKRWATLVTKLREQFECETVLDYGCGQGGLGHALGNPDWFFEYDPAIAGKDTPPARADIVICTDVLEHVEPELLDNVLADLREKIRKVAVFNISTRPANKTLPDGRNAHLTVEPAPWWEEKLEPYFHTIEWDVKDDELFLVLGRAVEIHELVTQSAVSKELRGENMALNIPRVAPRVGILPANQSTAILCCYGPSLHDTWQDIPKKGAYICTVSGAHDFLIERGVIPAAHIEADAREHKATYTKNPHPRVQYLIASCCHPATITQLIEQNLALWHVGTDRGSLDTMRRMEPGAIAIGGGGSVGLRAMAVLYTMGFRRFLIHGMDCSFAEDTGEQHAGYHAGKKMTESPVRVAGRWFKSSMTMVSYARYFFVQVANLNEESRRAGEPMMENGQYVEVGLAGDGLLQAFALENQRLELTDSAAPAEAVG